MLAEAWGCVLSLTIVLKSLDGDAEILFCGKGLAGGCNDHPGAWRNAGTAAILGSCQLLRTYSSHRESLEGVSDPMDRDARARGVGVWEGEDTARARAEILERRTRGRLLASLYRKGAKGLGGCWSRQLYIRIPGMGPSKVAYIYFKTR